MNEFQNLDLLNFVSKMKRKPNDGNCLFALSLVNRCPVKKRREFPGNEARGGQWELAKGWMSITQLWSWSVLRKMRPIQYKLNKILPDSEDWLADRRWFLISISPTIHFCNSVDHHIINSKSYEVALNPETKMMWKNAIGGRRGSGVCQQIAGVSQMSEKKEYIISQNKSRFMNC